MNPSTRKRLESISAIAMAVLIVAALIALGLFIESWRAEVWAERFHEWRPK